MTLVVAGGAASWRRYVTLPAMLAIALAIPCLWPVVLARWGPPPPSRANYLPAFDVERERVPFDPGRIEDLQSLKPGFVILGDSMGGRIDPARLAELSGERVAPILQFASGSAYWFLTFKNSVIASQVPPKWVIVFFRDTNLTDPLWRLDGPAPYGLDPVARDREDDLNAIVAQRLSGAWHTAHTLVDRAYRASQTRRWLEPALQRSLARTVSGAGNETPFLDQVNALFALEHLRPLQVGDMGDAVADTDFDANVDASTLPLFLRLARAHHIRLCFVRALRRPENGRAPDDPPAMAAYISDLREYLHFNGAVLLDDADEPEMALLPYDDGDHLGRTAQRRYTELFYQRLRTASE